MAMLLRDPADRLLSLIHMYLNKMRAVNNGAPATRSCDVMAQFAARELILEDNIMTHTVAGTTSALFSAGRPRSYPFLSSSLFSLRSPATVIPLLLLSSFLFPFA